MPPIPYYYIADRADSDRRCEADAPSAAGTANGKRRWLRVPNTKVEVECFVSLLRSLAQSCEVAFEPTGDDHRPLAYIFGRAGFRPSLISSLALARTRDVVYNSRDKNDPKDARKRGWSVTWRGRQISPSKWTRYAVSESAMSKRAKRSRAGTTSGPRAAEATSLVPERRP